MCPGFQVAKKLPFHCQVALLQCCQQSLGQCLGYPIANFGFSLDNNYKKLKNEYIYEKRKRLLQKKLSGSIKQIVEKTKSFILSNSDSR